MKPFPLPLLLAVSILLSGCARMKVTSEKDETFSFSDVQTYQWINGPEKILNEADTYIHADVQKALDRQLQYRGLRAAAGDESADVQMAYYIKLMEQQQYTTSANRDERDFSGGFTYNRARKGWDYTEREPDINVYTVEIGTLTLLVFDASTSRRVWRGNLQTRIDRSRPQDKQRERIDNAAEKLIDRIPQN